MWVSALLGMVSSFAECSLAQLYKERDGEGQFRGGPAWYMARGLEMRWMGVVFSILLLLAYGVIFNTVQANSVAHAMAYAFDLPMVAVGAALAAATLLIIVRGLRGVARLMQWFVPLMALIWVGASLLIGLWHFAALPAVLKPSSAALWLAGSGGGRGGLYHQPGAYRRFPARDVFQRSRHGLNAKCCRCRCIMASASRGAGHRTDDWRPY